MKQTIRNIAMAAVVLLTGCQELPSYLSNDAVLARAGGKELRQRDVQSVVPKKMSGADSVAFLDMYVERWVRKQLKLQEAGVLFSSSEADIADIFKVVNIVNPLVKVEFSIGIMQNFPCTYAISCH